MIQSNLLIEWIKNRNYRVGSEITLDIGNDRSLTPDLLVFPKRKLNLYVDDPKTKEIPVSVAEILSASQSAHEVVKKARQYLELGVETVWVVVVPFHLISIHMSDGKELKFHDGVASDPITGLMADLEAVFS